MRRLFLLLLLMWGKEGGALETGDPVPDVRLTGSDGRAVSLRTLAKPGVPLVVLFWGPGCPCSAECDAGVERLVKSGGDRLAPPVVVVVDPVSHPDERAQVEADRRLRRLTVPVRFDHDVSAARAFLARTTPAAYVFDARGRLAFQGAFERLAEPSGQPIEPTVAGVILRPAGPDAPPPPITWPYAEEVVEALRTGRSVRYRWVQPTGCPILHEPPLPPPSARERTMFSK